MNRNSRHEIVLFSAVAVIWTVFSIAIIHSDEIEARLFSQPDTQLADCCGGTNQIQQ